MRWRLRFRAISSRSSSTRTRSTTAPKPARRSPRPSSSVRASRRRPSPSLTPGTELGLQATQLIVGAAAPLTALRALAQDFPRHAPALARRVVVSDEVRQAADANALRAPPGTSAVWLNGAMLADTDASPFACVAFLQVM
jgi:hypothetical protein